MIVISNTLILLVKSVIKILDDLIVRDVLVHLTQHYGDMVIISHFSKRELKSY